MVSFSAKIDKLCYHICYIKETKQPIVPVKTTCQHGNLCPRPRTCPTPVPGRRTCLMGLKEYPECLRAQNRAGRSRRLQQTPRCHSFKQEGFFGVISPVHLLQIPYPRKTAGPCADCILPCTCRPWWSGRWGGTAGSSLHCCCCRDWCLGTQKHRQNKNPRGWEQLRTNINGLRVATEKNRPLHLSAQFHCRSSCASWGTCCSSGPSSCRHPSCRRFLSGRFLGQPTTTCSLKDAK